MSGSVPGSGGPRFKLRDVERVDGPVLHRWWEIYRDAQSDRPVDYRLGWEVARVALPSTHPDFDVQLFAAYDTGSSGGPGGDARMVGAGLVNLPMTDNTHLAYLDVYVDQPDRRRGVGSLLLDEVERRARATGRRTVQVEVFAPSGGTSPGVGFAESRGYTLANRDTVNGLPLPAAAELWPPLRDEVARESGGYDVRLWDDTAPDEYAAGFCAMLSRFIGMIPVGDLEIEDGEWTVERLRASEQRARDIAQHKILAVAVSADGSLAGASEVRLARADPRVAFVGLTMVLPEHRGHRLGLAMKLATHEALRTAHPDCELVITNNADVNAQMIAINEALGYQVVEQGLEYQHRL